MLFSALAAAFTTLMVGALSRRLLGVPIGWPRTIAVALVVFAGVGQLMLRLGDGMGLLDADDQLLPGVDPLLATVLLLLVSAWAVAIGLGILVILEAIVPTGTWPGPITLAREAPARWRRSRRYARILTVLTRHGLGGYLRGRSRNSADAGVDLGVALRSALTDGGVTFVKLGQMLSTRPDLVGATLAAELSSLTADVAPEPWEVTAATLRAEWGADPGSVLAEIDERPLAAASVGSVHTARLTDGTAVVVKVQRQDAAGQVAADLDILARLAVRLERHTDWAAALGARQLVHGFAQSLRDELDFRVEAANTVALRACTPAQIRVPQLMHHLSGRRVLVLGRLPGSALSRAGARVERLPVELRQQLATTLMRTVLTQVLDTGVFHADLHAGNVFLVENESAASGELDPGTTGLGLIDFGSVGRLDSATRQGLGRLLLAVDRDNAVAAVDALLEVVDRPAQLDVRELERDLGGLLAFLSVGGARGSGTGVFTELFSLIVRHRFRVPPQVAAAFRALGAVEGTLGVLDPGIDVVQEARQVGADLVAERSGVSSVRDQLEQELVHLLPMLRRLPRRLDDLTSSLQRGELSVNVRILDHPADRSFITGLMQQVTVVLLAAAAAIAGVVLITADGGPEAMPGVGWFPVLGATLFLFAFVLAARSLAVAFQHHTASRRDQRGG